MYLISTILPFFLVGWGLNEFTKWIDVLNRLWLTGMWTNIFVYILVTSFIARYSFYENTCIYISCGLLLVYMLVLLTFSHHVWDVQNLLFALVEILRVIFLHRQAKIQQPGKYQILWFSHETILNTVVFTNLHFQIYTFMG